MTGGDLRLLNDFVKTRLLGKSVGEGFYKYDKFGKVEKVSEIAMKIINNYRFDKQEAINKKRSKSRTISLTSSRSDMTSENQEKHSNNPLLSPTNIEKRIYYRFCNEVSLAYQENSISSCIEADTASCLGIGFPVTIGGPFKWMDSVGVKNVVEGMRYFEKFYGECFRPADILVKMAESDGKFY